MSFDLSSRSEGPIRSIDDESAGTYTGRAKHHTCDIIVHSDSAPEGADAMPNKR